MVTSILSLIVATTPQVRVQVNPPAISVKTPVQIAQARQKLVRRLNLRKVTKVVDRKRKWTLDRHISAVRLPVKPLVLSRYAALDVSLVPEIEKAKIEVEDQGARGTCTVFATKFLAEYTLAQMNGFNSSLRLNPEYLNWAADEAEGHDNDGSSFPAVTVGLDKFGCCAWGEDRPYKGDPAWYLPNYVPSLMGRTLAMLHTKPVILRVWFDHEGPGMTQKEMDTVIELLDVGVPVAVGQQWPAGGTWAGLNADGFQVYAGTGPTDGAHTMAIVGYKKNAAVPGGGYFQFRNSWGSSETDDGYLMLTFDWVKKHTYDGCIGLVTG